MRPLTPQQILYVSIGISVVLVAVGIITADAGIIGNVIILSTFIIATPVLYFRYKKFRESKEMDRQIKAGKLKGYASGKEMIDDILSE